MQKICVYPGSFDPITMGHLEIIKNAANIFDKVIVLVAINPGKTHFFNINERADFIRKSVAEIENVEVDILDGLLVNYAKKVGAMAIVKGLRAVSDFEYEFQMALVNKKLNNETQTIFIPASQENLYLSSSIVRQIGTMGEQIKGLVPDVVHDIIKEKLIKRNNLEEEKWAFMKY